MKRRIPPVWWALRVGAGVIALWVLLGFVASTRGTTLGYQVRHRGDGYEIRDYTEYLVAQVSIRGSRAFAMTEGSRILESYLHGDNLPADSVSSFERIALATPLIIQERGEVVLISAVLPSSYTIVTIPRPNNPEIRILRVPASTLAVRSWWGSVTSVRLQHEEEILRELLTRDKRVTLSAARIISYSPSWVLSLLRWNETAIPVRKN